MMVSRSMFWLYSLAYRMGVRNNFVARALAEMVIPDLRLRGYWMRAPGKPWYRFRGE